ncbi:hypothetical protein ACFO5R_12460 [Halosolutus amylolyticus]|uniref:Uncharacterized protein n=1 Tax=Halosolutus amylolyticus TaxID=2932267 RepID=A0ABD5PQC1_9EURY|nr:hypothetical protein [Halosolutus amylolyticus]
MKSATPALLAFLLVCSLPAMTVVAVGPAAEGIGDANDNQPLRLLPHQQGDLLHAEGTTNRLTLSHEATDVTSSHAEYQHDLGTELAITDDELRIDQSKYAILDREFDDATDEERSEKAEATYSHLKDRMDAIEAREKRAVREHASGDISDAELLQTLVRNYREALVIHDTLSELDDRTDRISGYSVPREQLRADRTILDFHQTQIRSSLEASSRTQQKVLLETSQNGYSLAMIRGGTYIVETTRFDNRDTNSPNQFEEFEGMIERTSELYPWAGSDEYGSPHYQDNSYENLYWIDILHQQGSLEVYLDAGSGDVHREVQELSMAKLPQSETETWSNDGLELTLNRTPANGPAQVKVVDAVSGEPQAATITIDGYEFGETDGDDGTLWILPPSGEYELGAETETGSINTTVSG